MAKIKSFQPIKGQIIWKVHFSSAIEQVYTALTTDKGRKTYWAEATKEKDGFIEFTFFNYPIIKSKIIAQKPPELFKIEYFETEVTFKLAATADGETDLTLINIVPDEALKQEVTAGWVSVLLAMKAAVDFGIDLRNHHPERTWDNGYLDN